MIRLAYCLIIAGVVLSFSGRVYHIVRHPEWTEPQALLGLWPLWLLAVGLIAVGYVIADREAK